MTQKIEALLFDLGGVVIDIEPARIFARWAEHAQLDAVGIRARANFDATYESYERGQINIDAYFAHVNSCIGRDLSHAQLLDGWNALFKGEMPGMLDLLKRAGERFPLYCLTNTNPAHEDFWRREYEPAVAPFRKIFVSSTIGMRKPDRVCFDHVIGEIGLPAERIMFFDDVMENIEGANACGLTAVHAPTTAEIVRAFAALGL